MLKDLEGLANLRTSESQDSCMKEYHDKGAKEKGKT